MKTTIRRSAAVVLLAFICAVWSAPAVADFDKATDHFRKGEYAESVLELRPLVEAGDPAAMNAMGVMLDNGYGVAKDLRAAAEHYRKSAEKGHPEGQYNWATMLLAGAGVAKDERKAAEWYRKSADQGDAGAQRKLGLLYASGRGLAKDQAQAVAWLRKAADQDDAEAQYWVGRSFAEGSGSPKDQALATWWFKKSADQGFAAAQGKLGIMLFDGSGIKMDQQLGVQWLRKAAEQGDALAQLTMGEAYSFGNGVDEDQREAARWYRMAADQGYAPALNNLGGLHERGAGGLRQDYAEAARLYEAAARQGNSYGQFNLARMYHEGLGVPSDAVVAYGWINLAASAESPHPKAADERDAMTRYMPKNLIADGQRLAREWKPGTSLGKSKLKPVDVAPLTAAWAVKVGKAEVSKPADQPIGQYPARPEAKPGLTTCNTRCVNGDCYRTYGDGRKVHFHAHQKWNPFNNQFEWDSGSC